MFTLERNGTKFTGAKRVEMRAKAWQLHQDGMDQRAIGAELGVSQATVSNWIKRYIADLRKATTQQDVAEQIRRELVCCDIFAQGEALSGDVEGLQRLRESKAYHAICYYGEWAARIAEGVK